MHACTQATLYAQYKNTRKQNTKANITYTVCAQLITSLYEILSLTADDIIYNIETGFMWIITEVIKIYTTVQQQYG